MSGQTLLRVTNLHRFYDSLHAVRGVQLEVSRGEVVGLLGANGAGKSSTLAMMAGVLSPSAGRVEIAGHDLLSRPRQAKTALGYLPDSPPLYPELSVDEFLSHCAALRGLRYARRREAVDEAKRRCGLAACGQRLIGNLSRGQRQRVGIAQAIAHRPEVVIMDEPTVALDPAQVVELRATIRSLADQHAVILSTHVLPEVQALCDRVLILHQGRIALEGRVAELARGEPGMHRVRFRDDPGREAVLALDAVLAANRVGVGRYHLRLSDGDDGVARFVASAARLGLVEIGPERVSLEQRFIAIACGDTALAPQ